MAANAPAHWCIRPSRRMHLFEGFMVAGAGLATGYALWPWLGFYPMAQPLLLFLLFVAGLRILNRQDNNLPVRLLYISNEHWRLILASGKAFDCRLTRIWRGWAWITLELQTGYDTSPRLVTVWRNAVAASAWHHLCILAAHASLLPSHRRTRALSS